MMVQSYLYHDNFNDCSFYLVLIAPAAVCKPEGRGKTVVVYGPTIVRARRKTDMTTYREACVV